MFDVVKKKTSRIVKQKLVLPEGVSYSRNGERLLFKGPQGEVAIFFHNDVVIYEENRTITMFSDKLPMAKLGTFAMLFKNAMNGVFKKFEKVLNLYGVGYKVLVTKGVLEFFVGYSHSIKAIPPSDIDFEVKTPTQVILRSCSNILLGDFAAKISRLRRVNPYKTKGIIEQGAFILKKEGKKVMVNRKSRNRFNLKARAGLNKLRFCVFRSCKHVSAQIIDRNGNVLADVSSSIKSSPAYSLVKMEKAKWVGQEIAKKVNLVEDEFYFDRGRYAYHGVIKALAEAAREAGMRF